MAPFPLAYLPWMALAPLLIMLADDLRKWWLGRRPLHHRPLRHA